MADKPKKNYPILIYSEPDYFVFVKDEIKVGFHKTKLEFDEKEHNVMKSGTEIYHSDLIVGLVEGPKTPFLVSVAESKVVGRILNAQVFQITKFEYIPTVKEDLDSSYTKMFDDFLQRNTLYFSREIDLTVPIKNYSKESEQSSSCLFSKTVVNYCWNYGIVKIFDVSDMEGFVEPIINGFFEVSSASEYSDDLYFAIIARKDTRRSGMRFLIRGADKNGNVANFTQTEEIFFYKDKTDKMNILSFLQIRGSIPLIWTQEPNFQLNPLIVPNDNFDSNYETFSLHISDLIQTYDNVTCVNLIDKKKDQKTIGEYYQNLCKKYIEKESSDHLFYVWFDFHSECKKMKYQNLSKLIQDPSISKSLNDYKYTHIVILNSLISSTDSLKQVLSTHSNFEIIQEQKGVLRTNCIDCLDRTNVVQSVFARIYAHKMLHDLSFGENSNNDPFQKFKDVFENNYKILWADHGDAISLAYSGTKALKSDFVRTGKRTLMGNLMDGYLSCKRFYINNLVDGYNQDCHDYFLGTIQPKKNVFKSHNRALIGVIIPFGIFLSFTMYFMAVGASLPKNYEDSFGKKIFRGTVFLGSSFLVFYSLFRIFKKSLIDTHTKHS